MQFLPDSDCQRSESINAMADDSIPYPIRIPIQQVQLYLLEGYLYIRTTESSQHLSCYYEHNEKCNAKIITDDETGQAGLLTNHSHSQPSTEFLKELREADNYNIVHLSHEVTVFRNSAPVKFRELFECKYCHKPFHDFDLFQRHHRRHEMRYKPHWAKKTAGPKSSVKKLVVYYKRVRGKKLSYQCTYCLEEFSNASEHQLHQLSNPYQCNFCKNCFSSVSAYFSHSHLNPPPKQCRRPRKMPKNVQTLVRNASEEEKESRSEQNHCDNRDYFYCKYCSRAYESKAELLEHNSTYPIFCNICQTCLASVSEFLKHETLHKRFAKKTTFCKKCIFCGVMLTSLEHMRNHVCSQPRFDKFHVDTNSANPTYKCTHCALVCQSYKQLITHATYKCKKRKGQCDGINEVDHASSKKKSKKKSYNCQECGKSFKMKRDSVACLQTHNPYHKCPMCTLFFDTEAKVQEHVEEGHTCRYCKEQGNGIVQFTRTHNLQIHIKRNHQLVCPHCTRTFTSQKVLFEHITDEHKCKYCKYNYLPSKEELIKHEMFHVVKLRP